MIKRLEDDDKGENDDDVEADGMKQMLPPKVANKGKSKITSVLKQSTASCGKWKGNATLKAYFILRSIHGVQKSLQSSWKNKEVIEQCDLAITKWIIDACVPFNAANSIYYQHSIDGITTMSSCYK